MDIQALREWALLFLKHSDFRKREIKAVEEAVGGFDFVLKKDSGDVCVLVRQLLQPEDVALVKEKSAFIFLPNTRENLKRVIANWALLSECVCLIYWQLLLECGCRESNPGQELGKLRSCL